MKKIASFLLVLLLVLGAVPVKAALIGRIEISPNVGCVKMGETITFSASAFDELGALMPGTIFSWTVIGPGRIISKTNTTLTYGAISPGSVTITASAEGISGSESLVVGSPKVKNVQVRVDPEIAGEVATYYIYFETDECGTLSPGDRIYVAFPYGTIFPKSYYCATLTVNGMNANYEEMRDDDRDTPILMIEIPPNFPITTQFYMRICKVINPRGGACYMIAVATDLQQQWSLSNSFAIRGSIITPPMVEVKPNIVGEIAQYTIKFKTSSSGRLGSCSGGYIMVEFPYGTKVPTTLKAEQVTINGVYCSSYPPEVNGRTVKLYPGMVVLEESDVVIVFSLEAGIQNPDTVGDYTMTVWTNSDNVHVDSQTYRIIASKIENLHVIVDKPYINTNSAYTIKFTTGLVGRLNINGLVTIYFPYTISLPKSSRPGDIKVNGVGTIKSAIVEGGYTLIIPMPIEVSAKSDVEIVISESFGLINPPDARKYFLEVHTAKEGSNVKSNEYLIGPSVIGDLSVNLKNPYIGVASQIDFSFKTGGGGRLISEKDQIYIVFPKGTFIPNAIKAKDILIQGFPLKTTPFLKKDTLEIVLMPSVDIASNTEVTVQFLETCGILNPKIPGDYLWQVATSREVSYIKSSLIRITESTIQHLDVNLLSNAIDEYTEMKVSFMLGEAGGLKVKDKIFLFLDHGFQMPDQYQAGVFLNQQAIEITNLTFDPEKLMIAIELTNEMENGEQLTLQITTSTLIKNPHKTGEYSIGVSTSKEPKTVKSGPLMVIPLPETDLKTTPVNPDGKNGWFVSDCYVSFVVYSSDKDRQKTYFSINGKGYLPYETPFMLSSGEYEISFFSSFSDSAKETEKVVQLKIDTSKPILDISENLIYTNKNPYPLSLSLIESHFSYALIGGIRIESLRDGKIETLLPLKEGPNSFTLIVEDLAGNESQRELTIIYDNLPPTLEITEPMPWTKTIRKKIVIKGKTEINGKVTINDKVIVVEKEGTFSFLWELTNGLNALSFVSTDLAGNQKIYSLPVQYYQNFQAKLVIGSPIVDTSFGKIDLTTPVYLEKGTTMVPLRFFTELLGCSITFEPVFQIITIVDPYGIEIKAQIGNTVFTVNQEKKVMTVPPAIKKGKTFIPIRFFAEEYGFIISYEKKEQAVILRYNER